MSLHIEVIVHILKWHGHQCTCGSFLNWKDIHDAEISLFFLYRFTYYWYFEVLLVARAFFLFTFLYPLTIVYIEVISWFCFKYMHSILFRYFKLILINLKVECDIHKSSSIIHILNQIYSISHIDTYFFKICFDIVLPLTKITKVSSVSKKWGGGEESVRLSETVTK